MDVPILPDQAQTDAPIEFRFRFDWQRPPLTANQRLHWRKRAEITRDVRTAAKMHALRLPGMNHVDVTLIWFVKDRRRRDVDNLVPTLKALCDGLVDAALVYDDTPTYMTKHMPVITYDPYQSSHLELIVKAVA